MTAPSKVPYIEMSPNQAVEFILKLPWNITVMLWGQPGIGKSDLVNEIKDRMGATILTVLASQSEPVDIQGLPNPSPCGQYYDYIRPFWGALAEGKICPDGYEDLPIIIFLDDVVNGEDQTLSALYKVVFENKARGGFIDRVRVIMAGNREEDGCNTRVMPTALSNRDLDIHITVSTEDWLEWSFQHNIHPAIRGFVKTFPPKLNTFKEAQEKGETKSYATPRSWEIFSNALTALEEANGNTHEIRVAAQGTLGTSIATEFVGYLECSRELISPSEIAALRTEDQFIQTPDKHDAAYAILSSYEAHCKSQMEDHRIPQETRFNNIRAGLIYAMKLRPEFGAAFSKTIYNLALKNKKSLGPYYSTFMNDAITHKWIESYKKYNG